MDATSTSPTFSCTQGTNYTQATGTTNPAWYTLVIDTVPGNGAGGGGGGPITPKTDDGMGMETKMMLLWGVLAVTVVAALAGYWYYQRYRRSQAAQQEGGLLYPADNQPAGGDPQRYTAME